MHQQIRLTVPSGSPQDLTKVLEALKNIQIRVVGGSNVEHGGKIAFGVEDNVQTAAEDALKAAKIPFDVVDVEHGYIPDKPGELLRFISGVRGSHPTSRHGIVDIAVGNAGPDHL